MKRGRGEGEPAGFCCSLFFFTISLQKLYIAIYPVISPSLTCRSAKKKDGDRFSKPQYGGRGTNNWVAEHVHNDLYRTLFDPSFVLLHVSSSLSVWKCFQYSTPLPPTGLCSREALEAPESSILHPSLTCSFSLCVCVCVCCWETSRYTFEKS